MPTSTAFVLNCNQLSMTAASVNVNVPASIRRDRLVSVVVIFVFFSVIVGSRRGDNMVALLFP